MIDAIRKLFAPLIDFIVMLISKVVWKPTSTLSDADKAKISELLKKDYYVICTRHSNYLSTYVIGFMNLLLTGRFGYYSHVLMNLEDSVTAIDDFRLLEATTKGVKYSTFDEVFGKASGVCLLKPVDMTLAEWTSTLDAAKTYLGRPYDTLYDLANDQQLSCVELVRDVLKASPDYATDFANFEKSILKSKNLAPQMFRDCQDFEVVLEIKR